MSLMHVVVLGLAAIAVNSFRARSRENTSRRDTSSRQSQSREFQRQQETINNRDHQFKERIQNLQGEVERQARENEKRISKITSQFQETIKEQSQHYNRQLNQLHQEISGEIEAQNYKIKEVSQQQQRQREEYQRIHEELRCALIDERNSRIEDMKKLQHQLDDIQKTQEQKKKIARDLLEGVDLLVQEIEGMPHQRFAPNYLKKIEKQINSVRDLIETMPEGAWANLSNAWNDLWDLKAEIALKEAEFWEKYNLAIETSVLLLDEATKNRERELDFSVEEETQREVIDVDYWSFGELEEYRECIHQIEKTVRDNETNMDFRVDDLDEILERLEEEGPKMGQIIIKAGNNVIASQIRFDMAEIGGNVLLDQFFKEDTLKATYEGEDKRAGFVLQIENENGTKATIVVSSPEEETTMGQFRLTINFENDEESLTPREIRERSNTIERLILNEAASIQAEKKGESICKDSPNLMFSDFEEVLQRPEEQMKTINPNLLKRRSDQ